jgi:hypothetical protein
MQMNKKHISQLHNLDTYFSSDEQELKKESKLSNRGIIQQPSSSRLLKQESVKQTPQWALENTRMESMQVEIDGVTVPAHRHIFNREVSQPIR